MQRVCLVIHTEATHHVDRRVGGWFNSDLTETGLAEATALQSRIEALGFKTDELAIYASDLNRTRKTAAMIAGNDGSAVVHDPRLREMSFGQNEGMLQTEHASLMQPVNQSGNRLDHRICEGAESRREVALRVSELVAELMEKPGDAIVVTHGFAGSFFIAAFQGIEISSMGYLDYKLKSGGITVLEVDDLFQNRSIRLLNG